MKNSNNKGIKFFLAIYNSALFFASLTLGSLLLYTFYTETANSGSYTCKNLENFYTNYKYVIMAYEVVQFAELIFHTIGISNLRYNALINILVSNFMLFAIIERFKTYASFYWISARVLSRGVKHMYNFYINTLGRYEIIWMDYFRFNSFYLLYPVELITMGAAVYISRTEMENSPKIFEYGEYNLSWLHIAVLFMIGAATNFASTSYYLHNKRQELIDLYIEKYTH